MSLMSVRMYKARTEQCGGLSHRTISAKEIEDGGLMEDGGSGDGRSG